MKNAQSSEVILSIIDRQFAACVDWLKAEIPAAGEYTKKALDFHVQKFAVAQKALADCIEVFGKPPADEVIAEVKPIAGHTEIAGYLKFANLKAKQVLEDVKIKTPLWTPDKDTPEQAVERSALVRKHQKIGFLIAAIASIQKTMESPTNALGLTEDERRLAVLKAKVAWYESEIIRVSGIIDETRKFLTDSEALKLKLETDQEAARTELEGATT